MKIFGIGLIGLLVIGYLAFGVLLYRSQASVIFPRPQVDHFTAYQFEGLTDFEEVYLPATGAEIHLVHFRTANPKGVVLFFHGNGDAIPTVIPLVEMLLERGYDVVVPDYRSYGKSSGRITAETVLHDDMALVYRYTVDHYAESDIILYGKSIGTGFAVPLAAANNPRLVILESPFYSLQDLVQKRIKLYPIWILNYQFRSDNYISEVGSPVIVIHGDRDIVIPHEQGVRLYDQIMAEKELLIVPGAGHESLIYRPELQTLFDRLLP